MAPRYFASQPLEVGQLLNLAPNESHHLIHVMRAKVGDTLELFDGGDRSFSGRIAEMGRRQVTVEIVAPLSANLTDEPRILVAAAVPKGDRFRFLIEKMTELGATAFLPLLTARAAVPNQAWLKNKVPQWIIEACKQSGRNSLLQVLPPTRLESVLDQTSSIPHRYIACTPLGPVAAATPAASPSEPTDPSVSAGSQPQPGPLSRPQSSPPHNQAGDLPAEGPPAAGADPAFQVLLLVGPEGGWTCPEQEMAERQGCRPLVIGSQVLRIETAALAALAWLISPSRPSRPLRPGESLDQTDVL